MCMNVSHCSGSFLLKKQTHLVNELSRLIFIKVFFSKQLVRCS